jgi:limonene-1,2-epoxide hydrolase
MATSAESVVRDYLAAWQEPKLDDLVSFFDKDALYVPGPLGVHKGIEAIRSELEATFATMTSATFDLINVLSDGTTVMVERVDHLTMGGRSYEIEAVVVFTIGADGHILRLREYFDLKSLMDQFEQSPQPPEG